MTHSQDIISRSHRLDGSADQLNAYYREWAPSYDDDVRNVSYCGPGVVDAIFGEFVPQHLHRRHGLTVFDAGCGTGLMGPYLTKRGVSSVDGADLSQEMISEAMKTRSYRILISGLDLNLGLAELAQDKYDVTVSCGVFTLGHVRPVAVDGLLRVTRPGGIVIISTRQRYLWESDFETHLDHLAAQERLDLVEHRKDQPYVSDELADYWVLKPL